MEFRGKPGDRVNGNELWKFVGSLVIGLLEVSFGGSWVAGDRVIGSELWKLVGSLVIGTLQVGFGSSWIAW